jgi:transcriptional regulator with XRE-family HTH domain
VATIDRSDLDNYLRTEWARECGARLRTRRTQLGLSLGSAAIATGLTFQTLSRIELGKLVPTLSAQLMIANGFGCRVTDIWPMPDMNRVLAVAGEFTR